MTSKDLALVADIGGTHSRFGLLAPGDERPSAVELYENDPYPTLSDALGHYLGSVGAQPSRGVIAIAGPIDGPHVRMTNRDWHFETPELARAHGMSRIEVVNDFAALSRALPLFRDDELDHIGAPAPHDRLTKLVMGPGTGLGMAGLVHLGRRWHGLPSEGGHVELAAVTEREAAIWHVARAAEGRVSAETLLSGPGLTRIDGAIAALDGAAAPPRDAAGIADAARAGEARAREVMAIFFDTLGRFAGDMALAFLARGGVYLYGGVIQKTVDLMDRQRFRAAFEAKAPHQAVLAGIATTLIRGSAVGLLGCAAIARDED